MLAVTCIFLLLFSMIYVCFKIYFLLEVQYTWIGFALFLVAYIDE